MMVSYEFIPEAEEDLKNIIPYIIKRWGVTQAQRYADLLARAFNEIADDKAISKKFSEKYPELRVTRCQHHYIFYWPRKPRPLLMAILHKRMDFIHHLKIRWD